MTPEQTPVLEANRQCEVTKAIRQYKQSGAFSRKSPNSQASYSIDLNQFKKFCQAQAISTLRELKAQDIANRADDLRENGHSAEATIARRISGVKSFTSWAEAERLLPVGFTEKTSTPRAERPLPKILTFEQTRGLISETLKETNKRDAALIQILLKTGAKSTELEEKMS